MLDVEFVFLARARKIIGQENVALLRQFVEQRLTVGRRDVDPDAAFAPIGMFDQGVAQRIEFNAAHIEESALGVAADRMLDFDDIGAPVREDRPCGGHECELSNLKDAQALHYVSHGVILRVISIYFSTVLFSAILVRRARERGRAPAAGEGANFIIIELFFQF
jgi:hypothetical protein